MNDAGWTPGKRPVAIAFCAEAARGAMIDRTVRPCMYVGKHSASNSYWPARYSSRPFFRERDAWSRRHIARTAPPQPASSSGHGDHGHDKPSRKQDQKSDNNDNGD